MSCKDQKSQKPGFLEKPGFSFFTNDLGLLYLVYRTNLCEFTTPNNPLIYLFGYPDLDGAKNRIYMLLNEHYYET